jgi:Cu/Ag efflux protein CusF
MFDSLKAPAISLLNDCFLNQRLCFADDFMKGKIMLRKLLITVVLCLDAWAAHAQGDAPQVEGEIRKVDTGNGKLTIRHGEIHNLQMGGMTMVFKATPEILARACEGEKIRFTADRVDGALTVTSLEEKR